MGGLQSAADPRRIRSDPRGLQADLWRIRRVYFSRELQRTCCGLQKSPPRTQKSAADSRRIRHRYAAEQWTFWSRKKPKKSASPPNESESVRRGLFFRFWRTIFSAADYFVRPGSAADSLRIFGPLKKSAQKILPIMVRLKSPLKKSILKICRRTSSGLRQGGQTSTDEVRLV